jgi:hypothetical protein
LAGAKCLGGDYFEGAVPIVNEQITKAGIRLAAWLNALGRVRNAIGATPGQTARKAKKLLQFLIRQKNE